MADCTLWDRAPLRADPHRVDWLELDDHSRVLHVPGWLDGAADAFDRIAADIDWQAESRPMYDRMVVVPRLTARIALAELEAHHPLIAIAGLVSEAIGIEIADAGLNLYRDGTDSVAWHRDRIGRHRHNSTVALVSLGGPRTLAMRRFGPAPGRSRRFILGSGDLFVMAGACQRDWEHCVPKTARAQPRISLGFRSLSGCRSGSPNAMTAPPSAGAAAGPRFVAAPT